MASEITAPRKGGTLRDLIGGASAVPLAPRAAGNGAATTIDLDRLDPNPFQPRMAMDEDRLAELAASIADHGLLQAITVRRVGDRFQIVAGHRRVAAYRKLSEGAETDGERRKYATIDAQEKLDVSDEQMALFALVENLQRDDISPVDAAAGLARYQETYQLSTAQVAERTGLDHQRVKRLLRLQRAPEVVKDGVTKGVMVPVLDDEGRQEVTAQGRAKQEHRRLDLLAALELGRLHAHWSRDTPKRAAERLEAVIRRALLEGWAFRRVQDYCRAAMRPASSAPEDQQREAAAPKPLFSCDERRLVVYFDRIAEATREEREQLRLAIDAVTGRLA